MAHRSAQDSLAATMADDPSGSKQLLGKDLKILANPECGQGAMSELTK
jgi:hypothetical protein